MTINRGAGYGLEIPCTYYGPRLSLIEGKNSLHASVLACAVT